MTPRTLEENLAFSRALLGPCEVDTTTPAWREAEAAGWDMWLVRDSLAQSAEKRLREHEMARQQMESLRAAFVEQYGEFRGAA